MHPLGFETDDKHLRRAGMDYWPRVDCTHHGSWEAYSASCIEGSGVGRHLFFTTKGTRSLWDVSFERGDRLVFGKESVGLADEILERHRGSLVTIPMAQGERSLNLASSAAIALYEAMRQACLGGWLMVDGGLRFSGR